MAEASSKLSVCPVCGEQKAGSEIVSREIIRPPVLKLIEKEKPEWKDGQSICISCLNRFRTEYILDIFETERGELSELDREIVESIRTHELQSVDLNREFEQQLTFGERLSDRIAEFGGSWPFIIVFGGVVIFWVALNSIFIIRHSFDPYPYILLNLILSCLAALQAPVIMMSQNRQDAKDRLRSEYDYRVNLKAELEIRHLHAKMDQLLQHQWERLLEIQKIQTDIMEEISSRLDGNYRGGPD